MKKITTELKKKVGKIIYDRGKKFFEREDVTLRTLLSDGDFLTIEGEYKEGKTIVKTSIIVEQKNGEYIEGDCDCLDYQNRKNVCRHVVALGMEADLVKNVIDVLGTDEILMLFDEKFEKIESKVKEKKIITTREADTKKEKKLNKNKEKIIENVEKNSIQFENNKKQTNIKSEIELIKDDFPNNKNKFLNRIEATKDKSELFLELEIDEIGYSDYRYGYDYERENFDPEYVFRLKVGAGKTYYIKDVIKFVTAIINNEIYAITNKFIYNPEIYYFNENNLQIITAINEFYEEMKEKDIVVRDKKGIKIVEGFYDKILDVLSVGRKIWKKEFELEKASSYEPLFIEDNGEIKFRDISQLIENSKYFIFKNDEFKFYKMTDNERKFFDEIKIETMKLNKFLGKKDENILDLLKKYEIKMAQYIDTFSDINLYIQEWDNNSSLKVKISDVIQVIEKKGKYFIPKVNVELLDALDSLIENIALEKLLDDDRTYIIDYDGLAMLSTVIDENYSDKVKIKLDSTIKKARNIIINFGVRKLENDLLDFKFEIDGIKENVDVDLVIEAIKNEKTFVTLSSGELVKIANKSVEELLGVVDSISGLKIGNNKISKIKALQLAQISQNIKTDLDEISEFKKMFKQIREKKDITPNNIKAELFPYQKQGFNWLKNMYDIGLGAILADDMGLGKTLQTISMLNEIMIENKDLLVIIVVPTSLLHNWKEEIIKFSGMIPILVEGSARKRKEIIKKHKKGILITTYQALRNDIEDYKEKNFDLVILDEAQSIKTVTSQIKKAVMKLNSKVNFALTGTPIENNILELWSIFDFVLHGYLDTLNKFKKVYKEVLINPQSKKIENLKNIIAPFILRRTKKEVLTELPDKFETDIVVQLSEEQKQLYLSYVKKAKKEISKFNKKENNRIKILAILTKLRQICNSPILFKDDYDGRIAKIEVLKDLLPDIIENDHRLLIFSQFVGTLKEIEKELLKQKIEYFYIDGGVPSKERQEICKKFNAGQKQVALISLKAGGTGLNLIGADVVIHYDPWWNIAVENQASDRAYRIGQKNSVQVIKLVTEGTIEEKILKIQENKRKLTESLIEGKSTETLFDMTDDELMELLS